MLDQLAKAGKFDELTHALAEAGPHGPEDLANALSSAVFRGDRRMVELLLRHGADPNMKTGQDWPAIFSAVEQKSLDLIRLLAEHGADLNIRLDNGFTPLHLAVDVEGDTAWQTRRAPTAEVTELLLRLGADRDAEDNRGIKPIVMAETYEHGPAIRLLKRKGDSVDYD